MMIQIVNTLQTLDDVFDGDLDFDQGLEAGSALFWTHSEIICRIT